ncbi:uncharacterized protein LOC132745390 [Ruditapes philippinarum]|uniref:uncharacterized protein LOC132745390 n=1 Tax=Ruditapes philippinarum TaxID=129788 RepID=UPI00295B1335|nr:uncharacterized protein LOC132745390 [Ruditapes philippinarum]
MVWRKIHFTAILSISVILHFTSAQLSTNEALLNMTECNLKSDIQLDCGPGSKIAINSLHYAYNVNCETACCTYDTSHCFVEAGITDIQEVTRLCSGKSECQVPISTETTDFTTCFLGVNPISYVYFEYYCIPSARIMSVCSNGHLEESDGKPLYLTSENYPAVTTGSTSCSCSLEVFSCTSEINMYTIDADLYLDTNNCEQNLNFLDTDNNTLSTIGCDEHYKNNIESSLLNTHYVKIDFINNSTSNQQGLFFVGLDASVTGERYKLTCSSQPETWCAGMLNWYFVSYLRTKIGFIDNGNITLSNENDVSYEATAEVTCDSGYKTDTPNIRCQANGSWPIAKCTEKPPCSTNEWRCVNGDCISDSLKCDNLPDCDDESDEQSCSDQTCLEGLEVCYHSNGSHVCVDKGTECGCGTVPSIENGIVSLDGNSSFGSVADVTCNEGYAPSSANIICLMTGSWETVSCSAKGTTPAHRPTKKKDPGVDISIIIVVVVLCIIFLLQLLLMCYLQCKIHNIRRSATPDKSEVSKRILMTILGSIPVLGLIPIYMAWAVFYRDVYKVKQNKQTEEGSQKDSKGASNPTYDNMPMNNNTGDHGAHTEVSGIELEYKTPEKNIHVEHGALKKGHNNNDAGKIHSESTQTINSETMHDGHQHGEHGVTMNRGISALFTNDDMALGPERNRQLSPIPQHP